MNENKQTDETDDLCRLSQLDEPIILGTLKVKMYFAFAKIAIRKGICEMTSM